MLFHNEKLCNIIINTKLWVDYVLEGDVMSSKKKNLYDFLVMQIVHPYKGLTKSLYISILPHHTLFENMPSAAAAFMQRRKYPTTVRYNVFTHRTANELKSETGKHFFIS